MAVAGINNVSVLESSYFGNQEKPVTRTSFIRKLWRDLDDETKNKQTERKQTNVNDNITGGRCSCSSEGGESENMSTITSEAENECPLNQIAGLQPSPAIGSADKERVRRVFREWGSKNININSNESALNVSHTSNNNNNCSRARLVCDTESLRVRTVRQWLESSTQQAETCQSPMEEQDGLGVGQTSVGGRKCLRLLYGRHALLDLLKRFEAERKKEMQNLSESQPVSTFAHRKRIKALLKGRFLLNQRFVQDEKPTSTAARDLGHLRQSQTVFDLRKGFLSRVNSQEQAHDGPHSDTASINSMKYQENEVYEDIVYESDTFSENGTKNQENLVHEDIVDESDTSSENDTKYLENQLLENTVNDNESERQQPPPPPTPQPTEPCQQSLELKSRYESNVDELELELEVDQAFDHLNASETETDILSWQEEIVEAEDNVTLTNIESTQSQNANSVENQDDWMHQENVHNGWYDDDHPVVTTDAFYIPDDEGDNNIRLELQRLTSRRRVSNLLQSGFRVRLNHVLQSYLARQHQASESDDDWMLETEHQKYENDEVDESTELGDSWQHPEVNQQSATDLEIINGLRMEMVMLQERMNSMQSALETCMKMQLELQRSVQQEVSLALNRSSNSGEESLQSCFLCCDSGSDSSPNRCGHVYVCANCAEKINWSKVKESVRHP